MKYHTTKVGSPVQTPSVGRVVHYVARGSLDGYYPKVCRAAIITQVGEEDGAVALAVLNPTGLFFHETVYLEELADSELCPLDRIINPKSVTGGTWHWPRHV